MDNKRERCKPQRVGTGRLTWPWARYAALVAYLTTALGCAGEDANTPMLEHLQRKARPDCEEAIGSPQNVPIGPSVLGVTAEAADVDIGASVERDEDKVVFKLVASTRQAPLDERRKEIMSKDIEVFMVKRSGASVYALGPALSPSTDGINERIYVQRHFNYEFADCIDASHVAVIYKGRQWKFPVPPSRMK